MGAGFARVTGGRSDDHPVDGMRILAVPSSGENLEEDSCMDQSDSDGTSRLVNLIPGKYFLSARDGWDLTGATSRCSSPTWKEQTLRLAPGESKSVTVDASRRQTGSPAVALHSLTVNCRPHFARGCRPPAPMPYSVFTGTTDFAAPTGGFARLRSMIEKESAAAAANGGSALRAKRSRTCRRCTWPARASSSKR